LKYNLQCSDLKGLSKRLFESKASKYNIYINNKLLGLKLSLSNPIRKRACISHFIFANKRFHRAQTMTDYGCMAYSLYATIVLQRRDKNIINNLCFYLNITGTPFPCIFNPCRFA